MTAATKDDLLALAEREIRPVEIAGGKIVYLRSMTAAERDAFEQSLFTKRKGKTVDRLENMRARLLVLCICDESGSLMFAPTDAARLGNMRAGPMSELFDVAASMNGITEADIEEMEGNSESDQSDASPSGSQTDGGTLTSIAS